MIPASVNSVVASVTHKICRGVEGAAETGPHMREWMWKLLCACDGLLFAESSASVEGSRRSAISKITG
eukprot:5292526-Lingulodinium_polyedra.AAC.1